MNCTKRTIAIGLILLIAATVVSAQIANTQETDPYEEVFLYAKKLEDNGMNKEASLEYKRYLFLQNYSAGSHKAESLFFLSHYYENEGDIRTAFDYFSLLVSVLTQDTPQSIEEAQLNKILLMKEIILQVQNNKLTTFDSYYNLSTVELNEFAWASKDSYAVRTTACCCLLSIALQSRNITAFQQLFVKTCTAYPTLFSQAEKLLIRKSIGAIYKYKPKNPMTAARLSVIPGAGQLYAHNYKDSLNAFILNGSLIAVSVYSLVNLNFVDFASFEFSPLVRFYRGNLFNAQRDAYAYNDAKLLELCSPIDQILLSHTTIPPLHK
jgi:hypothetical protein